MTFRSFLSGFLLLLFIGIQSWSQTVPATPKADYSKQAVVIEKLINRATFESDGTGARESTVAIRMVSDAGVQQFAVLSFAYSSENETVDVDYVRVRKPDGSVVNTPSYNIQDMPAEVTRSAPMYSDVHEKHIAVKGLGVGDTLEYLIRERIVKPLVPAQFWYEDTFVKDVICKDEQLEISVPKDKYVKVSSPGSEPSVREEAGRKIYSWKSKVDEVKEKGKDEPEDEGEKKPSVQITTFKSWEELGRWYGDLQKGQIEVTPAIQAKVAELTKSTKTDEEKIQALYSYVATKFHYVSLSFGIGRYQPHSAVDVLENEYGDCKDKHTLLATMLRAAGFEAWPVLISTTRKLDPAVPSPAQFNHVITLVPRPSGMIWLDTTTELGPFAFLAKPIRDKQALAIPTDRVPLLMKTPANPPYVAKQTFHVDAALNDKGTLTGHMEISDRTDYEFVIRLAYRRVPEAEWKTLAQRISQTMGFGGEVSSVVASPPEQTIKPFEVSYNYERKNYSDWENRQITPPLPPIGIESYKEDEKKPKEPLYLGAPGELLYTANVELPAGYKAEPPHDVHLVKPYAEYHSSYELRNNQGSKATTLSSVRRFIIKTGEVPLDSWEDYKKFRKAVAEDESRYTQLDSTSDSFSESLSGGANDVESEFREGTMAIQRRDFKRAEQAFKAVLEKDPKYRGAHFNLGLVYVLQNRRADAFEEVKKEAEINPSDLRAYSTMTNYLVMDNKVDEAIDVWRKFLANNAGDRVGSIALSGLLNRQKKYDEAVKVLEAADKQYPGDPRLEMNLGIAYLKTGDNEKGKSKLQSIGESEKDPNRLNDVAYSIAEANVELDIAKKYAERAVSDLEARIEMNTDSDDVALPATNSLAMAWDTLGWVYYKRNEMKTASDYMRAAWVLGQHGTVADHLGQYCERVGKKKEAAHYYELALAAVANTSMTNPMPKEEIDQIRERYKALTGTVLPPAVPGSFSPASRIIMDAGSELSRVRSIKLPTRIKTSGSATFSLVISAGKIEAVRYVNGDGALKSVSTAIKNAKPVEEFPAGSTAKVVRRGLLYCGPYSCDLVMLLPNTVNSIQ